MSVVRRYPENTEATAAMGWRGGDMKFVCEKCCDEVQLKPCKLEIPKGPAHTKKDVIARLTTCPLEGCDYIKGKWKKNGEVYKAEWKQVKR